MLRYLTIFILMTFVTMDLAAQTGRLNKPAGPQEQPIIITGGTVYTVSGAVIENGAVAFEEGVITYVGPVDDFNRNIRGWEIIDASNRNVYPGLIALNTRLGLSEIDRIRAMRDYNETGTYNPNVRSLVAYNTDSDIIPTIRANGILLAQIAPSGGRISGMSSVVQLDAWNWEDAAYHSDNAIHMNWPGRYSSGSWWAPPEEWEKREISDDLDDIYSFFKDAYAYYQTPAPESTNLRMEAMKKLFSGESKLFVSVNDAKGIKEVIDLSTQYEIDLVIKGGEDAMQVIELIKKHDIPVVIDHTHKTPSRPHDDIDQPYKLPSQLEDAGITFSYQRHQSWRIRNLPFYAGTAIAHGLDHEAGLRSLTIYPAQILGIDDRTGSLEAGKDANIVICDGDIMDMKSSRVERVFIQGRSADIYHHQEQLHEIYMNKYNLPMPEKW